MQLEEKAQEATAAKKRNAEETAKAFEAENERRKLMMESPEEEYTRFVAEDDKVIVDAKGELTRGRRIKKP